MIFTEKQIRELLRMIEFQHTFFIAGNVSAFVLTDHDKELLKSFGIDWEKFTSELTPFQQEFYFGRQIFRPKAEMPAQADDPRRADKDRL